MGNCAGVDWAADKHEVRSDGTGEELLAETTQPAGTDLGLGIEARCRALLSEGAGADDLYREAIDRLSRTRLRPELKHQLTLSLASVAVNGPRGSPIRCAADRSLTRPALMSPRASPSPAPRDLLSAEVSHKPREWAICCEEDTTEPGVLVSGDGTLAICLAQ